MNLSDFERAHPTVTRKWLAEQLGVPPLRVSHWGGGFGSVPSWVDEKLDEVHRKLEAGELECRDGRRERPYHGGGRPWRVVVHGRPYVWWRQYGVYPPRTSGHMKRETAEAEAAAYAAAIEQAAGFRPEVTIVWRDPAEKNWRR